MLVSGNIKQIQLYNQKYVQPDPNFEFMDSIIVSIIHADPECTGKLSVLDSRITFYVTPSNPKFKQSIIDNLVKLNKLLKIKIVFGSSLKITPTIFFSLELK